MHTNDDLSQPSTEPSVRWNELLAAVLLVVLCDLTIYRGAGLAGYALLFVTAPLLLAAAMPLRRLSSFTWLTGMMIMALALRLVWCGAAWSLAMGFALIVAFVVSATGRTPFVSSVLMRALESLPGGKMGLEHYMRSSRLSQLRLPWLSIFLPITALFVFGVVFICANPNLVDLTSRFLNVVWKELRGWLSVVTSWEIVFWFASLWLIVGLIRARTFGDWTLATDDVAAALPKEVEAPARLYPAYRNTLVAVIGLFTVYLAFEIRTLWFREFPEGFHYSGYAHEGAAWLTVALAIATFTLSIMFRGTVLADPRLQKLRRLAWIWSILNLLLALAVYNRLFIYMDFNGMTRMRTVALFGISTVVVGFLLVVWKIYRGQTFVWLVRRQLWALAIAVYLYALTPVDLLVTRYNVSRIMAGEPAPSVEISVHPINSTAIAQLFPLLECDNEIIREGIRAMLAVRATETEQQAIERAEQGWTAYQWADVRLLTKLRAASGAWDMYASDRKQQKAALERFHDYAYQWY